MNTALEKYRNIMRRYHTGEFGDKHLYLHQILALAGEPNLFNEMTFDELSELLLETDNISYKAVIAQIRNMKIPKEDMSQICGKRYMEYWEDVHVHHTMAQEDFNKWLRNHCNQCIHLSEICMKG